MTYKKVFGLILIILVLQGCASANSKGYSIKYIKPSISIFAFNETYQKINFFSEVGDDGDCRRYCLKDENIKNFSNIVDFRDDIILLSEAYFEECTGSATFMSLIKSTTLLGVHAIQFRKGTDIIKVVIKDINTGEYREVDLSSMERTLPDKAKYVHFGICDNMCGFSLEGSNWSNGFLVVETENSSIPEILKNKKDIIDTRTYRWPFIDF